MAGRHPERIGDRYVVERPLGRGSTGVVYLARDEQGRRYAVKVLQSGDEATRVRFIREARSAATLNHPNIVPALEIGEAGDSAYYVMPYVEGESLGQILRRDGRRDPGAALDVAIAVATALECAHAQGIVHRDVKPSNILIPRSGYADALLTDFGLQGHLLADTGQTAVGHIFGSPYYMSPEQVRGLPQSPASDIFGLGVVLYEMLYGQRPYEASSIAQLVRMVETQPITFPTLPDVGADVRALITACLEKDFALRPTSVSAQLRRLRRALVVAPASPPSRPDSVAAPEPMAPPEPVAPPRPVAAPGPATEVVTVLVKRPPAAARVGLRRAWLPTSLAAVALVATGGLVMLTYGGSSAGSQLALGLALTIGGALAGALVMRWLQQRPGALAAEAARLLGGTRTRSDLTRSLAIDVDELLVRCRSVEERFLGASLAIMIDDFRAAERVDDQHRALTTAVELLEKLTGRLSPWYVRYEKLIAAVVALLGIVPGLYQIVETLSRS